MGYTTFTARPRNVLVSFSQLIRSLRTLASIMQESTLSADSHSVSDSEACFDALITTTSDLCTRLEEGSINSFQIVETYLAQIAKHNTIGAKCRAVISTPPKSLIVSQALELDRERAEGCVRGPLHGIPILLKVHPSDQSY